MSVNGEITLHLYNEFYSCLILFFLRTEIPYIHYIKKETDQMKKCEKCGKEHDGSHMDPVDFVQWDVQNRMQQKVITQKKLRQLLV